VVIVERRARTWPLWLLALPAFVAVWSGWVGMGKLCGFGVVQPLPGIWDSLRLDTSITLPIGMEAYAAYAIKVWLSGEGSPAAVGFARRSTITALSVGALGQVVYHLLTAAGVDHAPWPITALAAVLPVGVLGMGATLAHLVQQPHHQDQGSSLPETHTVTAEYATPARDSSALALTSKQRELLAGRSVEDLTAELHRLHGQISERANAPRPRPPRATTSTSTRRSGTTGAAAGDTAARVAELLAGDRHLTSAALADRLGCSERTARRHRTAVLNRLDQQLDQADAGPHDTGQQDSTEDTTDEKEGEAA